MFNPKALIARNMRPDHKPEREFEAHFEGEPFFAYGATEQQAAENLWKYYEAREANPSARQIEINARSAAIGEVVGFGSRR